MQPIRLQITDLPREMIFQIVQFLEIQELFALECIPYFKKQFQKQGQIITYLIRKIFNTKSNEMARQIMRIYRNQPAINLPFWGYKTDGGVLNNNIPYWIGKAFLKSKQPTVGMMRNSSCTFSGAISQQYLQFVKIIMQLSKVLRKYIGQQHFDENMDNTTLRLVIMLTFHITLHDGDDDLRQRFNKYKLMLIEYAHTVSHFINQNQDYQMQNKSVNKLDQIANIHEIQFSRQFNQDNLDQVSRNRVQTFIVGVKNNYTLKEIKTIKTKIFKTNLTQEEIKNWTIDKFNSTEQGKYILFKQNQQGLVVWFDFGKQNKYKLKIPFESRPWAKQIHVCIVRGANQQSQHGLTFSYIACRGIVL